MIVLDAAALVDLVLDQPSRGWVTGSMRGHAIVAPAHQPAEVLSALARLLRAGALSEEAAHGALAEVAALPQQLVPPTGQHLRRARELQEGVRVLDGLYVALAEDRDVPLVTTDERLRRGAPPTVRVLTPDG